MHSQPFGPLIRTRNKCFTHKSRRRKLYHRQRGTQPERGTKIISSHIWLATTAGMWRTAIGKDGADTRWWELSRRGVPFRGPPFRPILIDVWKRKSYVLCMLFQIFPARTFRPHPWKSPMCACVRETRSVLCGCARKVGRWKSPSHDSGARVGRMFRSSVTQLSSPASLF